MNEYTNFLIIGKHLWRSNGETQKHMRNGYGGISEFQTLEDGLFNFKFLVIIDSDMIDSIVVVYVF